MLIFFFQCTSYLIYSSASVFDYLSALQTLTKVWVFS